MREGERESLVNRRLVKISKCFDSEYRYNRHKAEVTYNKRTCTTRLPTENKRKLEMHYKIFGKNNILFLLHKNHRF